MKRQKGWTWIREGNLDGKQVDLLLRDPENNIVTLE